MTYHVSVVMPALNEEGNIVEAIENAVHAFRRLGISGEIVVVDDGSSDRTGELVRRLMRDHSFIQLLRHETPRGIGRSFWDGVQHANGDVVTMLPGDAENDGYEILRYLPLMKEVDVVVPFVFNRGKRSWMRRQISTLYKTIINKTFGTSFNYMNGTVMYRRSLLRNLTLKSDGFFYQTELLIKITRAGYLYAEVPYGLKTRAGGKSKATTLKSLKRVIGEYIATYTSVISSGAKFEIAADSVSAKRRAHFEIPGHALPPLPSSPSPKAPEQSGQSLSH